MLMGINVSERDYLRMSDKERLALLEDAYKRTKSMKYQAISYLDRIEILPSVELTEWQEMLIYAYKNGFLGLKKKRRKVYAYNSGCK